MKTRSIPSRALVALALVAAMPAVVCAGAQDLEGNIHRVEELLRPFDGTHKPGFAVGVIQDGRLVYSKGYGMANLDDGVPITPHTVFRIGSTSKQFTAACIAMLVGEGKLALNDPVQKYIPELPDFGAPVTVGDLVHHTSGLPDYEDLQLLQGELDDQGNHHADEIVELLARQRLIFEPGEKWSYSNSNYILLAVIIERVSGRAFAELARERIFEPLGMRSSLVLDDNTAIVPNRAIGYSEADHGYRVDETITELVGDDGVFTTVEDLLLWDRNFYDGRIGGPGFLDRMQTVGTLASGEAHEYAFALMISEYRGLRTVSHGGSFVGFRAQMIRFPDQHFTVALLANLSSIDSTGLCHGIADIFLEEILEEPAEAGASGAGGPEVALSRERMNQLAGHYEDSGAGMSMEVAVEDDRLVFKTMGQTLPMAPLGDGVFKVEAPYDITLDFSRLDEDHTVVLKIVGMGRFEMAPVHFIEVPEDRVAEYAGEYCCERLATRNRLVVIGGALHLRLPKVSETFELTPTTRDVFSAGPRLRGISLEFRRGSEDEVTGFGVTVPGNRVADISFSRCGPS